MTASAEGPAKGLAAEAIYGRLLGRMVSLATGHAGNVPTLRLAAGLSGHEVQPAASGKGRRRRSGRAAVALGRRIRRSAAGARVGALNYPSRPSYPDKAKTSDRSFSKPVSPELV